MIDDIKKDAEVSMAKAIEALNNACGQIRARRPYTRRWCDRI